MSSFTDYKGLKVITPAPTDVLKPSTNNETNFKTLADRVPTAEHVDTVDPTSANNAGSTPAYYVNSRWLNTTKGIEYICTASSNVTATWTPVKLATTSIVTAAKFGAGKTPTFEFDTDGTMYAQTFRAGNLVTVDYISGISTIFASPVPFGVGATFAGNVTARQYAATAQTLVDGATINWNMNNGAAATVTLAGNRTLAAPTNMQNGATYYLIVKQDATGSRTLAFNSAYKFPGGTDPVVSTAGNAVDILTFISDGTSMYGVCQKAFA
jgi:hypothetical protein